MDPGADADADADAEPAGIAGVFDRAAHTYDAVDVEWFGPIARGLVAELAPAPGQNVLDIGCGRGAALFPLAEAVGPAGHALGIDLSPRMIAETAKEAAAFPQVELRVADAAYPGLPPSSYDRIASSLVLFFLSDPAGAVAAWRELLVAGGRLGVATFSGQDTHSQAIDAIFVPHLPKAIPDALTAARTGPFASDEGVEKLFKDAGLVDVHTVRTVVPAVFRNPEQWLDFSWSHGQRARWENVPAGLHQPLQEAAFALLEDACADDGTITFNQDVRYTLGRNP
jgi:ubiquinone/menaquinone biosynthesis C-methylase UbiE